MMHRKRVREAATCLLALTICLTAVPGQAKILFRLENRGLISMRDMVADARKARVILFGEIHSSAADHAAQLALIQALHEAGIPLAVGMETFQAEAQPDLERWVSGALEEEGLRRVYERDWAPGEWILYREILIYARQEKIPLVGLNVPEEVVAKVSRGGFKALTDAERRGIGVSFCEIPARYEELLKSVLGEKSVTAGAYSNFCEAQLVWDASMANRIAAYLAAQPERVMVVLCGTFHAWRHGIPRQLMRIAPTLPTRVILPTNDKTFLNYSIIQEDADYIWWQE